MLPVLAWLLRMFFAGWCHLRLSTFFEPHDVFLSLQGLETRGPVFNRRQAEEWSKSPARSLFLPSTILMMTLYLSVHCQEQVMNRVEITIAHITKQQGHQLIRRPFHASWFSNQLSMYVILRVPIQCFAQYASFTDVSCCGTMIIHS